MNYFSLDPLNLFMGPLFEQLRDKPVDELYFYGALIGFSVSEFVGDYKGVNRNKSRGGKIAQCANFFIPPPPGSHKGRQNLNCK